MGRLGVALVFAVSVIQCYGAVQQLQMPMAAEMIDSDDLHSQIQELRKNVSEIWTYINQLRTAVSGHLTHLRQHQVELESAVHNIEYHHEGAGDSHHSSEHHSHSGEHHSHSEEQHSHGGDHGSDHYSHGADHSHGSDHSHSGEHHSHSDEHHSHSGERHSHSSEYHPDSDEHHSHSYSHSHSSHGHSMEGDSHSYGSDHHHDHKDSHETEDLQQQTQQVAPEIPPVAEPIVTATNRHEHYHQNQGHSQTGRSSDSNNMNLMNEHGFHHHHHHGHNYHDAISRNRNRTVELPKYSDYYQYDFAICDVQANRAIPEDEQQNVAGRVTFWQKKSGGPLNLHVRLHGFQMGDHHGHHGAHQAIQQEEDNETPPQEIIHKHGFHVHSLGDLSNGCQSTGPHYNPKGVNHGGPTSIIRHVGDLGNIECDNHGYTNLVFSDDVASLQGQYSIVGKAVVVHSNQDDLGMGDDAESLRTGNAGTRIACCVIQKVDKLPIRYYKTMRTATQYRNY